VGQPAARREGKATAASYATSAAGLSRDELSAMIHDSPIGDRLASIGDSRKPETLALYLSATGLTAEAYNEWLARVCEQTDDK
jgi:hypothetical protein